MSTQILKTKTFSSGLRVAVVPDARATTATALVLVAVGASFETKEENGLSHFLEHVCFKGTARRPTSKVITEEIESLGAVTNAFTDREFTGYFIKGNPDHIGTFVDILGDIYQHSTFPEGEIEKEKGVIIEEINMYEDMPQYKVGDVLFDMLYPDQAAGRSILGTKESVLSFSQKDFHSYKHRFYTAANTIVVFSGKITEAKAFSLARKHFGGVPRSKKNKKVKTIDRQTAPASRVVAKTTDQAHMTLAFRSLPLSHKDIIPCRMLSTLLGRGMSSRLSLLVREELGAAYYVYAQQESLTDHGIFSINAGVDKRRINEVLERIITECVRLKEEPITKKELDKVKEYSIGTLRLGLELSDSVAEFYGGQMILGQKVRTPEQTVARIKKVTAKDLMRVARLLFTPSRANLAVVGPFKEGDVKTELLKKL